MSIRKTGSECRVIIQILQRIVFLRCGIILFWLSVCALGNRWQPARQPNKHTNDTENMIDILMNFNFLFLFFRWLISFKCVSHARNPKHIVRAPTRTPDRLLAHLLGWRVVEYQI